MPASSGTVAAGDLATATQYNNLRADAVHGTTSHIHDGTYGTLLTFATPVATGTANSAGVASTYPRSDHVHLATLGTAMGSAAAGVALAAQNTWYTVASIVNPGAGTWMATGHVQFGSSVPNVELRMSFGGTVTRTWTLYTAVTDGSISDISPLAAAGTIAFEARRTNTTAGTALTGSHIVAIKVG